MLNRFHIRCRACNDESIFRFALGIASQQRFVFPCPRCGARLRGVLSIPPAGKPIVDSADYDELDAELSDDAVLALPAATVSVDLPVHVDTIGKPLSDGGSPFLALRPKMVDNFENYFTSFLLLREGRQTLIPAMLRLTPLFVARDWPRLSVALANDRLRTLVEEMPEASPRLIYLRLLQYSVQPLVHDVERQVACHGEVQRVVEAAFSEPRVNITKAFLAAPEMRAFLQHLRCCLVDVSARIAEQLDMFVPVLAIDRFTEEWRGRLSEFRWFRDDFEIMKQLYVDAFETASMALALLGPLSNIAARGDASRWADDGRRKATALVEEFTSKRTFVLNDFPHLKRGYDAFRGEQRNVFSHARASYDFASSTVRRIDGSSESVFAILGDLRESAPLMPVLLGAVDFVDSRASR